MRAQRERRLVGIQQAAAELGITEAELNRRMDAGLPHHEAYGQRWLSQDSLDIMLEGAPDD